MNLRVGSLEITAALAAVAALAARPSLRGAVEIGSLSPMQLDLEVIERRGRHPAHGRTPFYVGRAKDAAISLGDPEVSRRHARFSSHDGVVYIEDCQSRNGTFLNGHRVSDAIEVRADDEIDVGTTRLVVTSVRPA